MYKKDVQWMGAGLGMLAVFLLISPLPRDLLLHERLGFPAKQYPGMEAAYIESHYPQIKFMNDYNIGGWLDYIWRGRVKVFVDGRSSSLFPPEVLQDYAQYIHEYHGTGSRALAIQRQYGFEGLILGNDMPYIELWHWNPMWKLVYQGETASVFISTKALNSITQIKRR